MSRAAIVSLLLLAACARSKDSWSTYRAQDGRFTVRVPAPPVEATKPQPGGNVTTVLVDRHDAGMFQVAHYAMPAIAGAAADTIDAALKVDCLAPYEDSLLIPQDDPKSRPLGAHRGIVMSGRADRSTKLPNGGYEEDRCYYIGDRLYHLIAIVPDDDTGRADVARFLDSFTLAASP